MDLPSLSEAWLRQQSQIRDDLISARGPPDRRAHLKPLVDRALSHYDAYYNAHSAATANGGPAQALAAPPATPLERAVQWIAGWRPSMLIQLLYSESGARFEAQLPALLNGVHSGDLGDLSPDQIGLVDGIQRRTIAEEGVIERELAELQESAPDPFPPSHADLDAKMERLVGIVERADGLRMRTLREVVGILDPLQAVDLLVAAADLEIGIRRIGLELQRQRVGS